MHLESTLLWPPELARALVPHGTSAIIADPHEIANVLGIPGVEMMLAASEGLPLDMFFMAPSCVPATVGRTRAPCSTRPPSNACCNCRACWDWPR